MLRNRLYSIIPLRSLAQTIAYWFLLFAMASLPITGQKSEQSLSVQSDPMAIQVLRNVIAQSGGISAWLGLRSAEESYSMLDVGETTPHIVLLLDDWSLGSTRYRRGMHGQTTPPSDHTGSPTFQSSTGASAVMIPEMDQARILLDKLPAAAAEVILRKPEYLVKTSLPQTCTGGDVCLDVFRIVNSIVPLAPEQQWRISGITGLPESIRFQITPLGTGQAWKEVDYTQYASEEGLVLPISIVTKLGGTKQTWQFVSFKGNPGFDAAKFDQEVAQ